MMEKELMTTIDVKEIEELSAMVSELAEALGSAEASLETIHLRSYRQEDYLSTLCTVRAYAGSRSKAAKEIRTRYEGRKILATKALDALLAFYKESTENCEKDTECVEEDGCPTETAVLKREWRRLTAFCKEVNEQEPVAWEVFPNGVGESAISRLNPASLSRPHNLGNISYTRPLYALPPSSAARIAELEKSLADWEDDFNECADHNIELQRKVQKQAEKLRIAQEAITFAEPVMESHAGPARVVWWKEALAALGEE